MCKGNVVTLHISRFLRYTCMQVLSLLGLAAFAASLGVIAMSVRRLSFNGISFVSHDATRELSRIQRAYSS